MLNVLSITGYQPFSGVSTWNTRAMDGFIADPSLGVRWSVLEFVDRAKQPQLDIEHQLALFSPAVRPHRYYAESFPRDNRWTAPLHWVNSLRGEQFDVVVTDTCHVECYIVAELLQIGGKRPAVLGVIHNDGQMHFDFSGELMDPANDMVAAVSTYLVRKFNGRYPDQRPARYMPLIVPVAARLPTRTSASPIRLCWSGRVEIEQKRVLDLPLLAAALAKLNVDFQLDVLGDGSASPALRDAVAGLESGVARRVRLLGRVPIDSMPGLLAEQHILVNVSQYEGTSVSMLEGMGQGLVPVVTDVTSGVRDVVRDGESGWIVPIGDVNAMAAAIARLANDRALLESASQKAWETVRDTFSASTACRVIAGLVKEAAALPRPPMRVRTDNIYFNSLDRRGIPNGLVRAVRKIRQLARGAR